MGSKMKILKDIQSGKGPIDTVKLMDIQNTLEALKNNPKVVPVDQLKAVKKTILDIIAAAPQVKSMLEPYVKQLNRGIKELSEIEKNEQ